MSSRIKMGLGLLLICSLWFIGTTSAWAQSDNGSISGFVRDQSGAVIPNAPVTVRNLSGLERKTNTSDSGYFIVTNIPPGTYSITVEVSGFKVYQSTNNKLDPSSTLNVEIALTVGELSQTVSVSASAAALQTESASVQKLVTRDQIDSLELAGRNPIFMAALVPGARPGNLSGLSFNFSQGPANFNGSRNPENLITYDGAPATRTRSNGTSLGSFDVDSTQEVQVLTADYSPEYGRSSGGQIRITSKSGTSTFHGAAYEYLGNDLLNANTWTRNKTPGQNFVPPYKYNQFGYNVGGPFYIPGHFNMAKNKVFFFWGQEWVRYRFLDSNSTVTVPSMLMRQGDFSELLDPKNFYYGKAMIIKDPVTGQPFQGNIIPASRLSQNGLGILKAWPDPNLATPINGNQNWYKTAMHPQNQRKDTVSIDINPKETQRIQIRYMHYSFWEYQPLDGGTDRTPKYFDRPNQTGSANWVWTLSPTKVNEFLGTVSLDRVWIPVDEANFYDRTKAGLNYPYIFPAGKLISTRIPSVNMSGFSGLSGGPYPSHSQGPIYDLSDSFTWVRGNHTFKFGFLWERSGENDNDEINVSACPTCTNNQNGQFLFTDTRSGQPTTGVAAANAALGMFDSYSELGQRAYTLFRGSMWEAFAQDKWKVNDKLLLDFGLRWTVIVPYRALWGNMIVFDPMYYDPAKAVQINPKTGAVIPGSGDRYNGMAIPGSGWPDSAKGRFPEASDPSLNYLFRGASDHFSDIQWGQFQPRLGIAYQITPKTVLRTGAGRFFTRLGVSDSIFLGGNPPFQPTANVSFGNVDNPGGTSANSLPLTVTTQSKAFKNPESWNWNVTVEREFFWNTLLSVAYVGRRGLHLQREANINQPTPAVVAANPGVNLDALRPYLGYNSIRRTDNVASSMYNSFQLSWNRRFQAGLAFGLAYTLSKSMDDGSNQRDIVPDTYYVHNLWGQSDFDTRHVMMINYLYDLPFLRNSSTLTGKMLGGWEFSGIAQFLTGIPVVIVANNDYAGVGQDGSMSSAGQYWVMNGTPTVIGDFAANGSSDAKYWFSTTNADGSPIWTAPAKGTFNHQEGIRDVVHNPGFINFNMGLFKKFAITEGTGLQFRAQAFNIFNHPNLSGAGNSPTNSSTFGKITGKTNDVRRLQFSLRFYF